VFPAVSSFLFTFKNLNLVTLLSLQIVMLVLPSIGPINHNANHICTSCLSHFLLRIARNNLNLSLDLNLRVTSLSTM
jgi:hypothetical protein